MNSTDNATHSATQADWKSRDTNVTVIITISIVGIFISIYFLSNMILRVQKWYKNRMLKKASRDSSNKIRCDGLIIHTSVTRGVTTDEKDETDDDDWRLINHLHLREESGFIRTTDRCTKKYPCCNEPIQIFLYNGQMSDKNGDLS